MNSKFYALLRLGLGAGTEADTAMTIGTEEWPALYRMAEQQALLGIVFAGAQQVGAGSYPPRQILMQWIAVTESIKCRNTLLARRQEEVTALLKRVGLHCMVLKGQSVAKYYPYPLLRQSGDIDVLVKPCGWLGGLDDSIAEIKCRLANACAGKVGDAVFHHLAWTLPDVEVEAHFRLVTFNCPFSNRYMHRWTEAQVDGAERTGNFNAVYLLAHFSRHLIFEGVGLRQLVDYYMVLRCGDIELDKVACDVGHLGLTRIARGVMWIMGQVFHLPDDQMYVRPDERAGRFVLGEVMLGGNFGRHDQRFDHTVRGDTWKSFIMHTRHRARFLWLCPREVLWDMPFRLYHWCWRRFYG